MYVRKSEEGLGQVQSPYIYIGSSPIGSYMGDLAQPQTLPARLRNAWNSNHKMQEIFDILRQQQRFPLDPAVKTELQSMFAKGSDELWLAETLAQFGPEPLWPHDRIRQRFQIVKSLGPDLGPYTATLTDPNPGGTSASCVNKLKTAELPSAFFFPGRSERRALIISGVHGDEKRGVQVVKNLQKLLEQRLASGHKPYFTTILVPVVIPRTQAGTGARNVPGGLGFDTKKAFKCRAIEPNRNFPLPGEGPATARARGAGGVNVPELMIRLSSGSLRAPQDQGTKAAFWVTSIRMLPETRILIDLIERFQPERLASVHDHSLKQKCHPCIGGKASKCGGEVPGIFMDPRGIDPKLGVITNKSQVAEDDELARRMVEEALGRLCSISLGSAFPPFAGNQVALTVRYFSQQRVEGNSLGDWAPVPTPLPAGKQRPGIATMTIEVPKYTGAHAAVEKRVIELHRDLLREIFLEP